MEQITIQVKSKQKARALIDFLKSLDFIEDISASPAALQKGSGVKEIDFFDLAGIWSGRELTLDSIRSQAWPARL